MGFKELPKIKKAEQLVESGQTEILDTSLKLQEFPQIEGALLPDTEQQAIRPEKIDDYINRRFNIYLSDLKLTIEGLHNKQILDVGSGDDRAFATAAKGHGINVISISRDEFVATNSQENTQYVQGVAEVLPFPNNSFDLSISHESFPMLAHPKNLPGGHIEEWSDLNRFRQAVEAGISEMIRVTKPEGEIRLGPIEADPKNGYDEFNIKELEVIHAYLSELKNRPDLEVSMIPVRDGDLFCVIIRRHPY